MLGLFRRPRAIADYDFNVGDGWHGLEVDHEASAQWADDLVLEVEARREAPYGDVERAALSTELRDIRARMVAARLEQPGMLAAFQISADERPRVTCVLVWRVTNLEKDQTPQSCRAALDADEGRHDPGERFNEVKTWMNAVDAGIAVGAYNVITYTDPGKALGRMETRAVVTVFVSWASQVIEFVFTTQDAATCEDMVALSMASVASLTVQLEK